MKPDAGLRGLLQIADEFARAADALRDATDEDSLGGRKVTLGELANIAGLFALGGVHVAGMIAKAAAGGGKR